MGAGPSMVESQRNMQRQMMQRQLQMQLQMRERMVAASIAQARDLTQWIGGALMFAAPALALGAARTGNRALLGPLFPLSVVFLYNYDFAYHSKMQRVLSAADRILVEERELLGMPGPALTVELLDELIARGNAAAKK